MTRFLQLASIAALCGLTTGCVNEAAARNAAMKAQAEAQVAAYAAKLRQQTTDTASYVRIEPEAVKERDPWGNVLRLTYTEGALSESFEVRSVGPDGEMHSADDIIEAGMLMNFKGVGRALREGVEETAENTARGLVKGALDGAKDSVAEGVAGAKKKLSDTVDKFKKNKESEEAKESEKAKESEDKKSEEDKEN